MPDTGQFAAEHPEQRDEHAAQRGAILRDQAPETKPVKCADTPFDCLIVEHLARGLQPRRGIRRGEQHAGIGARPLQRGGGADPCREVALEGGLVGIDEPAAPAQAPAGENELQKKLDERTADLQRLSAEYANYRKRVERDREVAAVNARASLASELLTVLDDVDRAAAHGDLTGAFKSVADKLLATLRKAGVEPFGHDGEPFDPSVHEAVQHDTSPHVDGPTVTAVLRRGYRIGDRVVRAALVAVTDHEPAAEQPSGEQQPAASPDQQFPAGAAGTSG